ncbi:hypothetical protein BGW41_005073 [Actinomortierella wolfii]|nr:hypothetical protein BGW41_005073 [Actinomortierella wolfii]
MGTLELKCITRQDSRDGTRTLYGLSYGVRSDAEVFRQYFRLVKSNPSPKSADEISWTLVEVVDADSLYYIQASVSKMICSVDPSGSLTIISRDMSGNIGVTRYDPSAVLASNSTTQSRWSHPTLPDGFSESLETSTIFNVPQPNNQTIVYHAAISDNGSEITFSYLNITDETMRTISTRWNLSSTLQGGRLHRLEYSSNVFFALASTNRTISLLTMPAIVEEGTSSDMEIQLLFAFNGTHTQYPVLVNDFSPHPYRPFIAVDNTYLIIAEESPIDVTKDVISTISLRDSTLGQFVRGTYFANVSDEYNAWSSFRDADSDDQESKMWIAEHPVAFSGIMVNALLLLSIIVFVVYKRKERRKAARQSLEDEDSRRSSTDSSFSQKQPVQDGEGDIPWADELPGKLVLVEDDNDNNDRDIRTQTNVPDGSNDTIIPLSNFVTPSVAPSHSIDNQPSAPPLATATPAQPPVHRQVVILSSHPRPRYFMSFEHEIEDNERDTQDPVQALDPLTTEDGSHSQQYMEDNVPSDSRDTNMSIESTGPLSLEQDEERIQRQLIASITDMPDVITEPPPVYEG